MGNQPTLNVNLASGELKYDDGTPVGHYYFEYVAGTTAGEGLLRFRMVFNGVADKYTRAGSAYGEMKLELSGSPSPGSVHFETDASGSYNPSVNPPGGGSGGGTTPPTVPVDPWGIPGYTAPGGVVTGGTDDKGPGGDKGLAKYIAEGWGSDAQDVGSTTMYAARPDRDGKSFPSFDWYVPFFAFQKDFETGAVTATGNVIFEDEISANQDFSNFNSNSGKYPANTAIAGSPRNDFFALEIPMKVFGQDFYIRTNDAYYFWSQIKNQNGEGFSHVYAAQRDLKYFYKTGDTPVAYSSASEAVADVRQSVLATPLSYGILKDDATGKKTLIINAGRLHKDVTPGAVGGLDVNSIKSDSLLFAASSANHYSLAKSFITNLLYSQDRASYSPALSIPELAAELDSRFTTYLDASATQAHLQNSSVTGEFNFAWPTDFATSYALAKTDWTNLNSAITAWKNNGFPGASVPALTSYTNLTSFMNKLKTYNSTAFQADIYSTQPNRNLRYQASYWTWSVFDALTARLTKFNTWEADVQTPAKAHRDSVLKSLFFYLPQTREAIRDMVNTGLSLNIQASDSDETFINTMFGEGFNVAQYRARYEALIAMDWSTSANIDTDLSVTSLVLKYRTIMTDKDVAALSNHVKITVDDGNFEGEIEKIYKYKFGADVEGDSKGGALFVKADSLGYSAAPGWGTVPNQAAFDAMSGYAGATFGVYSDPGAASQVNFREDGPGLYSYDAGGSAVITGDANGKFNLLGLLENTDYYIKELTAPAGAYLSPECATPYKFRVAPTVVSGGSAKYYAAYDLPHAVKLTKTDDTTAAPLAGAVFKIYNASTDAEMKVSGPSNGYYTYAPAGSGVLTTGADGVIRVHGLPVGSYYFLETSAPNGYDKPAGEDAKVYFTIDNTQPAADGYFAKAMTNTLTVAPPPPPPPPPPSPEDGDDNVWVYKVFKDNWGSTIAAPANISEVNVRLSDTESGETYDFPLSPANGWSLGQSMPFGEYDVSETSGADGFVVNYSPKHVTIGLDDVVTITVTNIQIPGSPVYPPGGDDDDDDTPSTFNPQPPSNPNPPSPPSTPNSPGGPGGYTGGDPNGDENFTSLGSMPVPLAQLPGLVSIFDDGVPLGMLPMTGGGALLLLISVAGVLSLVCGLFLRKASKRTE